MNRRRLVISAIVLQLLGVLTATAAALLWASALLGFSPRLAGYVTPLVASIVGGLLAFAVGRGLSIRLKMLERTERARESLRRSLEAAQEQQK